jgi:hypothetical protein
VPFATQVSDNSVYISMVASYHSGLPILSTYLSRPSVSETLDIFKQFMPYPYNIIVPKIKSDRRDIAVILCNEDINLLSTNEKETLAKCKQILKTKSYTLLSLSVDSLAKSEKFERQKKFDKIITALIPYHGFLVKDTNQFIACFGFDSLKSSAVYRGKGAFVGNKTESNEVFKILTEKMDTAKQYCLSFWYYNHVWDQTFNASVLEEKDNNGKTLQTLYFSPLESDIVDGWWYFSEHRFKVKSNKSTLSVYFHGADIFEKWYAVDELMIRPVDMDVYNIINFNNSKLVFLNNRKYVDIN